LPTFIRRMRSEHANAKTQRNGSHALAAYVEGKLDTYPSNACKQPGETSRRRTHPPKRCTKAANHLVSQICDQKVGHGDRVQDGAVAVVTLQRTPQEAKPRALQRTAAERNGARTPAGRKARACSTRPVAGPMAAQRVREQKPWSSQVPGAEGMQSQDMQSSQSRKRQRTMPVCNACACKAEAATWPGLEEAASFETTAAKSGADRCVMPPGNKAVRSPATASITRGAVLPTSQCGRTGKLAEVSGEALAAAKRYKS